MQRYFWCNWVVRKYPRFRLALQSISNGMWYPQEKENLLSNILVKMITSYSALGFYFSLVGYCQDIFFSFRNRGGNSLYITKSHLPKQLGKHAIFILFLKKCFELKHLYLLISLTTYILEREKQKYNREICLSP